MARNPTNSAWSVALDSGPTLPLTAVDPSRPATMLPTTHGRWAGVGRSTSA